MKKHPKNQTTPRSKLPSKLRGPFCCPMFEECTKTGEIGLTLPPYIYIINTRCDDNTLRWHHIAYCPFCGASKK